MGPSFRPVDPSTLGLYYFEVWIPWRFPGPSECPVSALIKDTSKYIPIPIAKTNPQFLDRSSFSAGFFLLLSFYIEIILIIIIVQFLVYSLNEKEVRLLLIFKTILPFF